jgi:hypothetical protein
VALRRTVGTASLMTAQLAVVRRLAVTISDDPPGAVAQPGNEAGQLFPSQVLTMRRRTSGGVVALAHPHVEGTVGPVASPGGPVDLPGADPGRRARR